MSPTQTSIPVTHSRSASYNNKPLILCPITGYPCEGDLSYLCEDMVALARVACHHALRKICN
jgi:hypothetical protein